MIGNSRLSFFWLDEIDSDLYNVEMECDVIPIRDRIPSDQKRISFSRIPNQSKLFLDFQYMKAAADKYYPGSCNSIENVSQKVLSAYRVDREELCNSLEATHTMMGAQGETLENIHRLRDEDCVAVIAGQQAGLFSGPMFTIYKAISAIKYAKELSEAGIKAVPLFWIASEDHDIEEANRVFRPNGDSELVEIIDEVEMNQENIPVSFIELGDRISASIEQYFELGVETEFTESVRKDLESVYTAESSFSAAFARYLLRIFGKYGLVLVCPMNESMRALTSPILVEAIENHKEITARLVKRDKELADDNYHSQVFVTDEFFPFFFINEENQRIALRYDSGLDLIRSIDSAYKFTKDELIEIAKEKPSYLSPNVLMRSIVQDYLFPTVCYFGGSAEIAYFAQNEVIYSLLNRPHTHFRHRSSLTIIDPKSERNLKRYDLNLNDMFQSDEDLMAKVIDEYVASDTAKLFQDTELKFIEQLNALEDSLIDSDLTLAANLANRKQKIIWHLQTLKNKFHRSEAAKNEVLRRRLKHTKTNLFPRNGLQERTLNVVYFLNNYGMNFIDWIYEATETDEKDHQIFYL